MTLSIGNILSLDTFSDIQGLVQNLVAATPQSAPQADEHDAEFLRKLIEDPTFCDNAVLSRGAKAVIEILMHVSPALPNSNEYCCR